MTLVVGTLRHQETGTVCMKHFHDNLCKYAFYFNRHVHIFHNVLGYTETIAELGEKIRTASQSVTKDRLKARAKELQASLDAIQDNKEEKKVK